MSRRPPELRRAGRVARAADPSLLRKVICGICGDETGEVALDPVGTCEGCATVMKHSSLDGEAPGRRGPDPFEAAVVEAVGLPRVVDYEEEPDYEPDYEDEEDPEDL